MKTRTLLPLALVLAACGGTADEASPSTTEAPTTTEAAPPTTLSTTTTVQATTTTSTTFPSYPYDFAVDPAAPVIKPQFWHSSYTAVPWVIIEDGVWHLFFSGAQGRASSLGLATSTDGLTYEKVSLLNPIFTPPGSGLGWFFIYDVDGLWHMVYVEGFRPPYRNVSYATADTLDGDWEDHGELFKAPDREWDRFMVPTGVTKVGDRYLMPYGGWGQEIRVPAIGILESTDGVAWEPTTEEPIYMATEGSWNEKGVVPMNIIETERGLELFYLGFNEQPSVGYQADVIPFGRLVSTDGGATWTEDNDGQPIGDTGERGWPGMSVVYQDGKYWVFLGDDLGSRGISLVTGTIP